MKAPFGDYKQIVAFAKEHAGKRVKIYYGSYIGIEGVLCGYDEGPGYSSYIIGVNNKQGWCNLLSGDVILTPSETGRYLYCSKIELIDDENGDTN